MASGEFDTDPSRAGYLRASAPPRWKLSWPDGVLAAAIFIVTVGYLALWPYNLGPADEAIHLYESKRLLDGEVLYRDVFEMITPGYMYLMALLFGIFGADVATARLAQAVIHGVSAVLLYAASRRLGVRPMLSWPVSLAYLVIAQPAWPIASQHWLSTSIMFVLLWASIDRLRERPRAAVLPGLVLGMLNAVQQQRGLIIAVGLFVWVGLDAALERRYQRRPIWAMLRGRWMWLVGGTLLVMVPILLVAVAMAGFGPPWRALVIFPLFDYHGSTHCPWGDVNIMTAKQASYTFPQVLKYLPLALVIPALRLLVLATQKRSEPEARRLLLLVTFCVTSMCSIFYFPDFAHIAFIAGGFLVTLAETGEWLAARLRAPLAVRRVAAGAATAVLLAAAATRLQANLARVRADHPFERTTAFGTIALASELEAELYDVVNELMATVPSRVLYCYPVISHLYLMTDSHNPTPYGFLSPGYSGPDLIQHVVEILKTKQPPYIVFFRQLTHAVDPISAYIREFYQPIGGDLLAGKYVYRRKDRI